MEREISSHIYFISMFEESAKCRLIINLRKSRNSFRRSIQVPDLLVYLASLLLKGVHVSLNVGNTRS